MAAFGGEIAKVMEKRPADPCLVVAADVLSERAGKITLLETISSNQMQTIRRLDREANKAADTVARMTKAMSDAAPGLWFQAGREAGNDLGAVTRRVFELAREQAGAEAVQKARIKAMQVGFDRHEDYADLTIRLWKNPPDVLDTEQKAA
jgi:replication-associated recombination protein RarA